MAAIFNEGIYHGFEVSSQGQIIERYGNPPIEFNAIGGVGACKPGSPVTVRRLTSDDGKIIYGGAYFVEALSANGDDVVIWVWRGANGGGWIGPYGG